MKNFYKLFIITFVLTLFIACSCTKTLKIEQHDNKLNFQEIRKSIVSLTVSFTGTATLADGKEEDFSSVFRGTGFIIAQNLDYTIIATAGHVCQPSSEMLTDSISMEKDISKFRGVKKLVRLMGARYYNNQRHLAAPVFIDDYLDLCFAITRPEELPYLKLKETRNMYGEQVYIMGFSNGQGLNTSAVPIFTAKALGIELYERNRMRDVFSGLVVLPGISGSPVFNEQFQVVSILHSVTTGFGYGANTAFVSAALKHSLEKIEANKEEWLEVLRLAKINERAFKLNQSSSSTVSKP